MNGDIHQKPDIYEYQSCRGFLRDCVQFLKKNRSRFSVNQIAKQSEVSVSYLTATLRGERAMKPVVFETFLPHLELNSSEESFLRTLWEIEEGKSEEERLSAIRNAQRFLKYKKKNPGEFEAYQFLTHWYYSVIQQMAKQKDFKADPKWIRKRLIHKISSRQIAEALSFLEEFDFLDLSKPTGKRVIKSSVICRDGAYQAFLARFHSEMLDRMKESITEVSRSERMISSRMFNVSPRDYEKILKVIRKANDEIEAIEKNARPQSDENVYYVSFGAIPLTKRSKE